MSSSNITGSGGGPTDVEVGEQTPLLSSEVGGGAGAGVGAGGSGQQPVVVLQEMKAESLKEKAVAATAAVSFFTSLLAMLFEATAHPVVYVSGILGVLLSPYAAFQQNKLTQVEALSQTNAVMEEEVQTLEKENKRLKQNVQQLEESVINLQAMEETLETLQSLEGESIQELQEQLEDSKSILAQMHRNVTGEILQNLISVMLACDNDGDLLLSDAEINSLIDHLEATQGVQLKEDLLRQAIIDNGRSLAAVMEVTRNLLCGKDLPPEQSIFQFLEGEEKEQQKQQQQAAS